MSAFDAVNMITRRGGADDLTIVPYNSSSATLLTAADIFPFLTGFDDGVLSFVVTQEDKTRLYVGVCVKRCGAAAVASSDDVFVGAAVISRQVVPHSVLQAAKWIANAENAEDAAGRAYCVLNNVPVPLPGSSCELRDASGAPVLSLRRNALNDFPSNNLDLHVCLTALMNTLSIPAIMDAVRCLLLERSLLLHVSSAKLPLLCVVAEGLSSLLFPLRAANSFIPYLPPACDLSLLLGAPFPCLLGADSRTLQGVPPEDLADIAVLDLDEGTIRVPGDVLTTEFAAQPTVFGFVSPTATKKLQRVLRCTQVPNFPPKLYSQVLASLQMYARSVNWKAEGSCGVSDTCSATASFIWQPNDKIRGSVAFQAAAVSRQMVNEVCAATAEAGTTDKGLSHNPFAASSSMASRLLADMDTPLPEESLRARAALGVQRTFVEALIVLIGDYDAYFLETPTPESNSKVDATVEDAAAYLGLRFDIEAARAKKADLEPLISGLLQTQSFQEFLSQRLQASCMTDPECVFFDALADEKLLGCSRTKFLADDKLRTSVATIIIKYCGHVDTHDSRDESIISFEQAVRAGFQKAIKDSVCAATAETPLSPGAELAPLDLGMGSSQMHKLRTKRLSTMPGAVTGDRKSMHPREKEWIDRLLHSQAPPRESIGIPQAVLSAASPRAGIKRPRGESLLNQAAETAAQSLHYAAAVTPAHTADLLENGSTRKRRRMLVASARKDIVHSTDEYEVDGAPIMAMSAFLGDADAMMARQSNIYPDVVGLPPSEPIQKDAAQADGDDAIPQPQEAEIQEEPPAAERRPAARSSMLPEIMEEVMSHRDSAESSIACTCRYEIEALRSELAQARREKLQYAMEMAKFISRMRVMIRIRPGRTSEGVTAALTDSTVAVTKPTGEVSTYDFDKVWGSAAKQAELFSELQPIVLRAVQHGENALIFAYGQTGSGKTFTMNCGAYDSPLPPALMAEKHSSLDSLDDLPEDCGVYARTVISIFSQLAENYHTLTDGDASTASVRVSMFEIYNEQIMDLLSPLLAHGEGCDCQGCDEKGLPANKVNVRLAGNIGSEVKFQGLAAPKVYSAKMALALLSAGNSMRATASNGVNHRSSRSHAVVVLQTSRQVGAVSLVSGTVATWATSKIVLVDLAGSERFDAKNLVSKGSEPAPASMAAVTSWTTAVSSLSSWFGGKTGSLPAPPVSGMAKATAAIDEGGSRLKESCAINSSLTTLGMVISALSSADDKKLAPKHVPFRDSILTLALSDCLNGSAHAILMCMLSPDEGDCSETISTLQFAARAKNVQTKAVGTKQSIAHGVGKAKSSDGATEAEKQKDAKIRSLASEVTALQQENATLRTQLQVSRRAIASENTAPVVSTIRKNQASAVDRLAAPKTPSTAPRAPVDGFTTPRTRTRPARGRPSVAMTDATNTHHRDGGIAIAAAVTPATGNTGRRHQPRASISTPGP